MSHLVGAVAFLAAMTTVAAVDLEAADMIKAYRDFYRLDHLLLLGPEEDAVKIFESDAKTTFLAIDNCTLVQYHIESQVALGELDMVGFLTGQRLCYGAVDAVLVTSLLRFGKQRC